MQNVSQKSLGDKNKEVKGDTFDVAVPEKLLKTVAAMRDFQPEINQIPFGGRAPPSLVLSRVLKNTIPRSEPYIVRLGSARTRWGS